MPSSVATRRASSTADSEQQPPWRASSSASSRGHCGRVRPTTSWPCRWSSSAATLESTPPESATAIRMWPSYGRAPLRPGALRSTPMSTAPFVLVHGGWHGAWCWDRVRPWLSAAGARVVAPDLPGHGADRTPFAELTPGSSVERLADVVRAEDAPVVLVGHSSGGMLISAGGGPVPGRVAALVYVSAFLLPAGVSPPDVMRGDGESLLRSSLVVGEGGRTTS